MMKKEDIGANRIKNYSGRVVLETQERNSLSNLTQTDLTLFMFTVFRKIHLKLADSK